LDDPLNDESISYIAIALKQNHTLLKLSLASTHMKDKAATFLAETLLSNNSLRSLNLQNNDLTSMGIECLADVVLHKNQSITSLNLHDNSGAYETVLLVDRVLEERKKQSLFGFHGLGTKGGLQQPQDEVNSSEIYSSFSKYAT
jgi:Ran GTPase-activating protein (RanGAP) involved in mRNA processing and transport